VGGVAAEGGKVRLTDDQLHRIGATILARWKAKGLVRPKSADQALVAAMAAEIRRDIQREEELDREAEALLEQHIRKIGDTQANSRILFQKIKERLAKDRGVVL
jgi:hypothetical protein